MWPSGRPPMEHLDTTADILGQQLLAKNQSSRLVLLSVYCPENPVVGLFFVDCPMLFGPSFSLGLPLRKLEPS